MSKALCKLLEITMEKHNRPDLCPHGADISSKHGADVPACVSSRYVMAEVSSHQGDHCLGQAKEKVAQRRLRKTAWEVEAKPEGMV